MKDRRYINIRVMFSVFCGLMVGILFPFLFFKNICSLGLLIAISIAVVIVAIGCFIYAEITHKYNIKTEFRQEVSLLIKGASIGFVLAFVVGIFNSFSPYLSMFSLKDYGSTPVTVNGIVSDYVAEESTYKKFILTDCIIDTGYKTNKISYKIVVYTTKLTNVELGDRVVFTSEIEKYSFFKDSDYSKLIQNIGYHAFVSSGQISLINGRPTLKDTIKDLTKDILDSNLNEDNANISYAILFGEKQGLSDNLSEMFSFAGISHILAVSGLHIGVLVSFLYFILRKLRINEYVRFILLGCILLFYSYLCSFTPSVCRASIMAMLVALCDILLVEYDGLASLSIAGIIILLFNPLSLFSISFQLSFLCLFAIISLAPTLTDLLTKIKLPKFLASSLAISVATNLAILPVCLNSFTKVSLLGIFSNILILPIFSINYVLLFLVVVLSLCFNSLGVLLFLPELFLQVIKTVANYISSIDFGIFKVFNITYWALFLIIVTSLIIHFLMIHKYVKGGIFLVLLIVIISLFVNSSTPTKYSNDNMLFSLNYDSNICYYVKDNKVTLIGSEIENNLLLNKMKKFRLNKIDSIIAYDLELNNLNNLIKIAEEYDVNIIYLPNKYDYPELSSKFKNVEFFDDKITTPNLNFTAINYEEQIIGVMLNIDSLGELLIPEVKPTKAEAKYLCEYYTDVDFVYINNDYTNIDLTKFNAEIISNEKSIEEYIELENIETYILNGEAL